MSLCRPPEFRKRFAVNKFPAGIRRLLLLAGLAILSLGLAGCLTKRTVTKDGRTVEKKYVVKRPVKNLIQNTEFE